VTYKKKVVVLSAIVVAMAVVYIFSHVFSPENRQSKAFAWLEPQFFGMIDGITISGLNGRVDLVRKNNMWFFSAGTEEYPARQSRVEDLLSALSRRQVYPLRAATAEASERLGLSEDSSSRIIMRGGAGMPLLDLLVGSGDALGREIYLRMAGRNEIYSGEDHFSYFIDSRPSFWYDLRLFGGESGSASRLTIDAVQQAEIKLPGADAYIVRRSGSGWVIPGSDEELDAIRLDAWVRSILEAEAEGFEISFPEIAEASITIWIGDGRIRTIEAGPMDEERNRIVRVSGLPYNYSLGEWNYNRLFRDRNFFIRAFD
jgi:hypothetical protein